MTSNLWLKFLVHAPMMESLYWRFPIYLRDQISKRERSPTKMNVFKGLSAYWDIEPMWAFMYGWLITMFPLDFPFVLVSWVTKYFLYHRVTHCWLIILILGYISSVFLLELVISLLSLNLILIMRKLLFLVTLMVFQGLNSRSSSFHEGEDDTIQIGSDLSKTIIQGLQKRIQAILILKR